MKNVLSCCERPNLGDTELPRSHQDQFPVFSVFLAFSLFFLTDIFFKTLVCKWPSPTLLPSFPPFYTLKVHRPKFWYNTARGQLFHPLNLAGGGGSRPRPGGKLGGLAGGVSRPRPGGGCIPACTETDPPADGYCCGRYASYWNALLLFCFFSILNFSCAGGKFPVLVVNSPCENIF